MAEQIVEKEVKQVEQEQELGQKFRVGYIKGVNYVWFLMSIFYDLYGLTNKQTSCKPVPPVDSAYAPGVTLADIRKHSRGNHVELFSKIQERDCRVDLTDPNVDQDKTVLFPLKGAVPRGYNHVAYRCREEHPTNLLLDKQINPFVDHIMMIVRYKTNKTDIVVWFSVFGEFVSGGHCCNNNKCNRYVPTYYCTECWRKLCRICHEAEGIHDGGICTQCKSRVCIYCNFREKAPHSDVCPKCFNTRCTRCENEVAGKGDLYTRQRVCIDCYNATHCPKCEMEKAEDAEYCEECSKTK